ncbi:partial Putative aliphatic sulfonates-binding protein, partial [Anaerolineae bacterium]
MAKVANRRCFFYFGFSDLTGKNNYGFHRLRRLEFLDSIQDRGNLMKRTRIAVRIVLAAIVGGFALAACQNSEANFAGKIESIRIGIPPNEQSTLILIAEDQHLFAKNGLDATMKIYDTALAAVEAMKKGEVDVSESAEFPVVREAFKKETLSIIASIDKFLGVHLVARRDRGIENVSDLTGKKIGAAQGTLTEFYLGRFLELHRINRDDVTIVNLPFSQSADALANGSVDAF